MVDSDTYYLIIFLDCQLKIIMILTENVLEGASMYLDKIIVKNYKAISDMEVQFTPGVNLLIGDNGVGKSSMLEAIVVAISGMFKGVAGVSAKGIMQNDIHFKVKGKGDASTEILYGRPSEITTFFNMDDENFCLKKYRESEDGSSRTKMEDTGIGKKMQEKVNSSDAILPLLCFQSDARVWQKRRGDFGKGLKKKLNDRRCGYIGCLDYYLDIKGIQEWCLKMEVAAFQKKKQVKEYEVFKWLVSRFMYIVNELDEVPDIYYSSQFEEMVYQEGNAAMPITLLSAGYQSLLWMIMNLAYRWALLNPDITENIDKAKGIVLIDEIDMHLHPKWQWKIIKALEKTFPNVQFILTTHSPIVISSCKNEHLILITDDQEIVYLENAYGYSVQDVLNFRQGTVEKPEEIKILADQFYQAMEEDNYQAAEKILKGMADILGENHADVKAAREELEWNNL